VTIDVFTHVSTQNFKMRDQIEKAENFRRLHAPTLVLPNAWDAASARLIEQAGAKAIATGSAGVSWALGYRDGTMPRDDAIEAVRRIVRVVQVPVTADIESGYGDVAATVKAIVKSGAVGINLEDSPGENGQPLVDPDVHAARISAAREAAASVGGDVVINARTDVFLNEVGPPESRLDHAVKRAGIYRAAGADCIFVPGVVDAAIIAQLVQRIDAPINIVIRKSSPPIDELKRLGVARVSAGPRIAEVAYGAALSAARELLEAGTYESMQNTLTFDEVDRLFQLTHRPQR
jgi:2-methylisocitrate lyase-like PEP mutase family enzyme